MNYETDATISFLWFLLMQFMQTDKSLLESFHTAETETGAQTLHVSNVRVVDIFAGMRLLSIIHRPSDDHNNGELNQ